jgi:hypothetical protein
LQKTPLNSTTRNNLRIWGSGVRISSGAPFSFSLAGLWRSSELPTGSRSTEADFKYRFKSETDGQEMITCSFAAFNKSMQAIFGWQWRRSSFTVDGLRFLIIALQTFKGMKFNLRLAIGFDVNKPHRSPAL